MKDKVCDFNHLILYAKGHYKHTDVLEDVRTILAHRSGLPKEHLSNEDVWKLVIIAVEKYCPPSSLGGVLLQIFDNYFPKALYAETLMFDRFGYAINLCLVELMKLTVYYQGQTLIELGVADENVLPFSEAHIKAMKEEKENG